MPILGDAITVTRLAWDDRVLAEVDTPRGPLRITLGLGSGLTRRANDPPGRLWAIGDRGPNLKVAQAIADHGLDHLTPLKALEGAKIMPRPALGPMLVELQLDGDAMTCLRVLPLTDDMGAAFSGLPIPGGDAASMEPAFDLAGFPLGAHTSGADTEAVVALANGGFWVAEEYGPSLMKVATDGRVLVRWVPMGREASLSGAAYPVSGVLPALAARRRLNRGFEALALSPDERRLHILLQSALESGDEPTLAPLGHARLWSLDIDTGACIAEHFYPFDPPESFARDAEVGSVGLDDLKICEAVSIGGDQLLVLERISHTAKIYRVALTERVLTKSLLLSTDDWPSIAPDLEGMAVLSDRTLVLCTDNDFGVEGRETAFFRIDFDRPFAG